MVSTRGPRHKFNEGERVLCYEPDPTKAKVLYDSKVMEVVESKDKRGRKTLEYLIHFQGWNSSWDRCVSEDFVLKDNDENRALQQELAEKSQALLRERKKNQQAAGLTGTGLPKRIQSSGTEDEDPSSSSQSEDGESETDSSSDDSSNSQESASSNYKVVIPIPKGLRIRLNTDHDLVVNRGRLTRIPAQPSALEILEDWIRDSSKQQILQYYAKPPPRDPAYLSDCLNQAIEVADGIRIYFDFILKGHLLFPQEIKQFREVMQAYPYEYSNRVSDKSEGTYHFEQSEENSRENKMSLHSDTPAAESLQSNIPVVEPLSSNTKIASPRPEGSTSPRQGPSRRLRSRRSRSLLTPPLKVINTIEQQNSESIMNPQVEPPPHILLDPKNEPQPMNDELDQAPPGIQDFNDVRDSGMLSDDSSSSRRSTRRSVDALDNTRLELVMKRVDEWELLTREKTHHLPCRLYGAIHLTRLFVKLPLFLTVVRMPDAKLERLLEHFQGLLEYLDEHSELFGESYYL